MRRSRFHALCASVLLITVGGCSFVFVDGPPVGHKKLPYFDCTSSNALPTVDFVLAGLVGIGALASLEESSSSEYSSTGDNVGTWVAVAEAALFAASGFHGLSKTASCREAQLDMLTRLQQTPPSGGSGWAPAGPGFAPVAPGFAPPAGPAPPYDPWLHPPPGMFAPPPTAAPTPAPAPPATSASPDGGAPTPPATDTEEPNSKR